METAALHGVGAAVRHENRQGEHSLRERQDAPYRRLPRAHHKHLKSTKMLERLNEEIKRRTRVVRIFPNTESCLRFIRALWVETHESWLVDNRYLNRGLLQEQKKAWLRQTA